MTANLGARTLRGVTWMLSGGSLVVVARLGVVVVLARILTPEEFGLFGAALIIVRFAELFSLLGVGPALVQTESLDSRLLRTGFTISTILGLGIGAIVWLSAGQVATFFGMQGLTEVVRKLTLLFPIATSSVVAVALLERRLSFKKIAVVEVACYVFGYGVTAVTLSVLGFGVTALVIAILTQAVMKSTLLITSSPHPKRPLLDGTSLKTLIPFTSGFALARVASFFALQGDNLIVGRFLGAAALGIYGRAYSLAAMPVTVVGRVVNRVLFPAFSELRKNASRLRSAHEYAFSTAATAALPLLVILVVLAPEIVEVVLGPQWTESVVPLRLLAFGLFFRVANKIHDALIRAAGKVYKQAWIQIGYGLAVLVGAGIGSKYGLPGVATGVVVALLVQFFLTASLGLRITGSNAVRLLVSVMPALLAASATLLALRALKPSLLGLSPSTGVQLLSVSVLGVLSYAFFLVLLVALPFGRITRESLRLLRREVAHWRQTGPEYDG